MNKEKINAENNPVEVRTAEKTQIEIGAGVKEAEITIPPDCNVTLNGERVFRLYELRNAAREMIIVSPKRIKNIPEDRKKETVEVLKTVFSGLGLALGVKIWP